MEFLIYYSTCFAYPVNQSCNIDLFPLSLMQKVDYYVHSILRLFLRFLRKQLCLHCILGSFLFSLSFVDLNGLSTIEQLLYIFLFIFFCILFNTGSYFVSILSWFRDRTSVSIQYNILCSAFSSGWGNYVQNSVPFYVHYIKIENQFSISKFTIM